MEVVNYVISAASGAIGHAVTLQQIFGYVLSPFAFLMGIPTQDIIPAGGIMGTKIVLNEFVAILDLKTQLQHYLHVQLESLQYS